MIHYLILAHDNLDQVELVANKLKTNNSDIYVHLDKKIVNFKKIKNIKYIKNRQHIKWWWTKMLEAELIWLSEMFDNMNKWDHVVIISDQCLPIKKLWYIENYIDNFGENSCIHYMEADKQTLNRICKYYFFDIDFHFPKWCNRLLIKILSIFKKFDTKIRIPMINFIVSEIVSFILPQRTYLINRYTIYWWSSRMVLSYSHIEFLLNFINSKWWKEVLKHFKYTANLDEVFFQTILVNNKKNEIINDCLWFTLRKKWSASPKFLSINDLEAIKKSNKLFARKFDITKDKEIVDRIDTLYGR